MPTLLSTQENKASVSFAIDDRIFLGEGLFETIRVFKGKPCYAALHWQRLQKAALYLDIPFEVSLELWLEQLDHCIKRNQLEADGIKVILSGGSATRGLLEKSNESHLVFDVFKYSINKQTLNLISAIWLRDSKNPVYQLKSVNYLEAIIARRHAQAAGADDALFFNGQHQATETTIANLFLIKDNQLFTPSLQSGVLAGIIRQRLLSLSREQGIDCFECELGKNKLVQADALFVCNALQGIRQVRSFEGHIFEINHPLITLLQELLAKDSYC